MLMVRRFASQSVDRIRVTVGQAQIIIVRLLALETLGNFRIVVKLQVREMIENSLRSIDYHQGIIFDTLTLNVAGGDWPNTVISIFRLGRLDQHTHSL